MGYFKENLHFLILFHAYFIHTGIARKLRKNFGYENGKRKFLRNPVQR